MRRSRSFLAPLALVVLVAGAAMAALLGAKALPASAGGPRTVPKPALNAPTFAGGHDHFSLDGGDGYTKASRRVLASVQATTNLKPTRYSEPKVIRSHNGVLRVTLRPHPSSALVNGRRIKGMMTFTGTYPGPTLRVRPGDTIRMRFINDLPGTYTNLHFHGFRVSPSGISDNVLRTIFPAVTSKLTKPGHAVKIVVHIPKTHERGLYWYHPHFHGNVDPQVYSGLAGLIEVGNVLQNLPYLQHIKKHVMALTAIELSGNKLVPVAKSDDSKEVHLVNGRYQPRLTIHPGELQLWRLANISNDNFYYLGLGKAGPFHVIAQDGNPVAKVWSPKHILMPPGSRFEFLVRGPAHGTYHLRNLFFNQGHDIFHQFNFVTLRSVGRPVANQLPIPRVASEAQGEKLNEVLTTPVVRKRHLVFSIKPPFPNAFYINRKLFRVNRVDEKVKLGTTEEWVLKNTSKEDHPFHIHTNDFVVERINGKKVPIHGFQDVVSIPHQVGHKPGSVLIRMRFESFQGKAVFHCHILFHEDHAMMGIVQFTRARKR
jgi:FtsP/CotA-like multicopper oxidase with cupredoxin domain